MLVYRIGRTKYVSDLTGEGARLYGGRWNHRDIPCLYTSQSRSLALLEYTANVHLDDIPRALSITIFEIPDHCIVEIPIAQLPGDWSLFPTPLSTRNLGSSLLNEMKHAVIKIPSAILPEEFNYLLNPRHPDNADAKILEIKDFIYDVRLKLK